MADGEHRLQIVEDTRGKRGSFGDVQSAWLQDQGIVERAGYQNTGPTTGIDFWRIVDDRPIEEISDLVTAQPELRECDFCSTIPAGWQIPVRPFEVRIVPGPFKRPIFACDVCVPMVRAGDRDGLVERRIEAAISEGMRQGGAMAARMVAIPRAAIQQQVAPMVREFVDGVFANRTGDPEVAG